MKARSVLIADLSVDPANARKHSQRNLDAIAASLKRFGQQKPIVVDKANIVRAGNGTLQAAIHLGWDSIDVVTTDLTGAEASAYAIADNRTAELAEWDDPILKATLEALADEDRALLDACGYTEEELDALVEVESEAEITEDIPPEPPKVAVSKPGDLWILGGHRLLCGSSLDLIALDRLLGGELCDMCFTDPPYNVAYQGGTKNKLTILNDSMSGGEFLQFLRDAFSTVFAAIKPGSVVYVCHADSEGMRFRQAFEESGLLLKQCLVWVKNCLVLGRQDYQWRHEPILYGWKPGEAHRFYGDRKQTTTIEPSDGVAIVEDGEATTISITVMGRTIVLRAASYEVLLDGTDELETAWKIDKPTRSADHPTMKPVKLCARAILHGTKKDEIVFDGFLGSGSTLIAAEQLSRRCFGFELDPKYADVIVKRWENLTGEKATLAT